ncbi:MAG: putative porin [Verrucomicrobiota bacterium]
MKNKITVATIAGTSAIALALCGNVSAQTSDSLIDKLVEKGILTVSEANGLREEADKGFTQAYSVKSGMPEWVNSLKFNGDLRLRYDGIHVDDSSVVDRHRFRYRLRFGATALLHDNLEVGLRLISGNGDPISGNATFEDNGSKKFIGIDLAYAKWSPINTPDWSATLIGGKMENPFVFSDMIFDSDYTPEGLGQQIGYTINERHGVKLNLGQFILDEASKSSSDPFLLGAQLRLESIWSPKWQSSFGISGLMIAGTENLLTANVPDINKGNTRVNINAGTTNKASFGPLAHKFNPIVVDGAVIYSLDKFPMYAGAFPIRFAADYANNPAAHENNQAFSAGVTFGKSGKKGTWDLTYRYKYLESDFWFEELVDSDTGAFYKTGIPQSGGGTGYGAGTNLRGHYLRAAYSPFDSVTLAASYFLFDLIDGKNENSKTGRLQVDASLKF